MFNNTKYTINKKLEPKTVIIESNETQEAGYKMTKLDPNYKKPETGTYQDKMTITDMISSTKGYRKLNTIAEKEILKKLPLFKTRVKYYDTTKKLFRTGGVLTKVEYPKYIMLMNIATKAGWSVQLDKNLIFIPEDMIEYKEKKEAIDLEKKQKDKLYKLYKNGEIAIKKK
jgi:hypothetical protein